jgi:hypothetical protein
VGTLEAMANPTGSLEGTIEQTVEMLAASLGLSVDEFDRFISDLQDIQEQLDPILKSLEESSVGRPPEAIPDGGLVVEKASGTSAYIQINCKGDGNERPEEFNNPLYGFIEIEDNNIDVEKVVSDGSYVPDGDLFFNYAVCQGGYVTIQGESPVYASDYYDNLLADMDATFSHDDGFSYNLQNYALFSSSLIVVLFQIGAGDTYTIAVYSNRNVSFILGTVEGEYFCTFGDDPPLHCGVL